MSGAVSGQVVGSSSTLASGANDTLASGAIVRPSGTSASGAIVDNSALHEARAVDKVSICYSNCFILSVRSMTWVWSSWMCWSCWGLLCLRMMYSVNLVRKGFTQRTRMKPMADRTPRREEEEERREDRSWVFMACASVDNYVDEPVLST